MYDDSRRILQCNCNVRLLFSENRMILASTRQTENDDDRKTDRQHTMTTAKLKLCKQCNDQVKSQSLQNNNSSVIILYHLFSKILRDIPERRIHTWWGNYVGCRRAGFGCSCLSSLSGMSSLSRRCRIEDCFRTLLDCNNACCLVLALNTTISNIAFNFALKRNLFY